MARRVLRQVSIAAAECPQATSPSGIGPTKAGRGSAAWRSALFTWRRAFARPIILRGQGPAASRGEPRRMTGRRRRRAGSASRGRRRDLRTAQRTPLVCNDGADGLERSTEWRRRKRRFFPPMVGRFRRRSSGRLPPRHTGRSGPGIRPLDKPIAGRWAAGYHSVRGMLRYDCRPPHGPHLGC